MTTSAAIQDPQIRARFVKGFQGSSSGGLQIGAGQSAVLSALGPGFCAEYVLMRGAVA